MATSDHFKQNIFFEQSSFSSEHYERTVSLIFHKDIDEACIEVRCFSDSALDAYRRGNARHAEAINICSPSGYSSTADSGSEEASVESRALDHDVTSASKVYTTRNVAEAFEDTQHLSQCPVNVSLSRLYTIELELGHLQRFIQVKPLHSLLSSTKAP